MDIEQLFMGKGSEDNVRRYQSSGEGVAHIIQANMVVEYPKLGNAAMGLSVVT